MKVRPSILFVTVAAVALQGDYAYMGVGPRLVILDISAPTHPAVVGRMAILPGVVTSVAVAEACAYVTAHDAGLRIVDVSDPAAPTEIGFQDTPGWATGVAVAADYA